MKTERTKTITFIEYICDYCEELGMDFCDICEADICHNHSHISNHGTICPDCWKIAEPYFKKMADLQGETDRKIELIKLALKKEMEKKK